MQLRITTQSGSIYLLDREKMTWSRPDNPNSPMVRTNVGDLKKWPEVAIGQPMVLIGTSLTPGGLCRAMTTSLVVAVDPVKQPTNT